MAQFDMKKSIGKNRSQTTKRCEIKKVLDFSTINAGAGAGNGDTVLFCKTPKNYVHSACHVILETAKGGAGTIDIGTAAAANGMLNDGNINGTPGATIALAGTEAGIPAGTLLSETDLQILFNQATVAGKVTILLLGFIVER